RGVVRIADAKLPDLVEIALLEALVDRSLHEQARAAETDLALVRKARAHDRVEVRFAEIEIGEHDRGILAAELERELLELRRGRGGDHRAGARRARERDRLDVGMLDERLADAGSGALHDVEDARRKAGFDRELAELGGRARRDLARLSDDRIAGRERRRDLPR